MADSHWEKWAEQDPYFAVLSDRKFRLNNLSDHEDEFFKSGEIEISQKMETINKLFGDGRRNTAVDFGCGVGRLVIPLKRHYERVIGIDVAPAMISEAKKNMQKRHISEVSFCKSADELPQSAAIDLVHSMIVFQHIDIGKGISITETLLQRLAPGGVAALHFSTKRKLSSVKEFVYNVKRNVPFTYLAFNLLQGKRWNEPLMAMNNYPIFAILDLFRRNGMEDLFTEPILEGNYGFIVYGRKRYQQLT